MVGMVAMHFCMWFVTLYFWAKALPEKKLLLYVVLYVVESTFYAIKEGLSGPLIDESVHSHHSKLDALITGLTWLQCGEHTRNIQDVPKHQLEIVL